MGGKPRLSRIRRISSLENEASVQCSAEILDCSVLAVTVLNMTSHFVSLTYNRGTSQTSVLSIVVISMCEFDV